MWCVFLSLLLFPLIGVVFLSHCLSSMLVAARRLHFNLAAVNSRPPLVSRPGVSILASSATARVCKDFGLPQRYNAYRMALSRIDPCTHLLSSHDLSSVQKKLQ